MNFFEKFEVPLKFFPDLQQIRSRYYELSRLYHPDLMDVNKDFDEAEMLQKSSDLNNAYRILISFEQRVAYILSVFGLMDDAEKARVSPSFLMEMMDVNESLIEARMEADPERLNSIAKEVAQMQQELAKKREDDCRLFDATQDLSILSRVKDDYLKNKYLERLREQLEQNN